MITTSARAIIVNALKAIGALAAGESPSSVMAADGLERMNWLIDGLGTQRQTIFTVTRSTYTWTADTTSFTIGEGASFNQQRPIWIDNAAWVIPGSSPATESPFWILTDQQYADQAIKSLTATEPSWLYYDATAPVGTGYGTLYIGPIPTQNITVVLYWPTAVSQFTSLAAEYVLPPGYARMLQWNLAKELLSEYGRTQPGVPDLVMRHAADSMADVKRANTRLYDLQMDPALVNRLPALYNIFAGP